MVGLSDQVPANVDGLSIKPLLSGSNELDRDALYWHYPHYPNQGGLPGGVIREGNLKLIEYYEDGSVELFDLSTDIGETINLADRMPEEAARLQQKLAAWRLSVDAQMPVPNPDYQ